LVQARHPLIEPERVVPIDVEMSDETFIVVITGPNTGGKTVALKTIGLLCLMTYCGLHIPVSAGSELCVFDHVYADIGDEQSIEQSLSTFSSHLSNLNGFLGKVERKSLVLLDELGAGTDPAEGSALARAILDFLRARQVTTFVATHYPELKIWASPSNTPGAVNASVEFDPETLSPTYRLVIGLPGRSNAFAIAARLGLDSSIVGAARAMVADSDLQAEDLLAGIHKARQETESARTAAQLARAESEQMERDLRARLAGIEDERKQILQSAQEEMQARLEALEEGITALRKKLRQVGAQEWAEIEAQRRALKKKAQSAAPLPALGQPPKHPIHVLDVVWVERLKSEGNVMEIDGDEAQVQSGRLRLRLSLDELEWRSTPQPQVAARESVSARGISPGLELDLRGERADDALILLERHLDAAYSAGLPWVRVIHGHGTGALKKVVRAALKGHALVDNFEAGRDGEGGDGVTVVKLAQES
jgi:DNA mismatch repair protein MutS2